MAVKEVDAVAALTQFVSGFTYQKDAATALRISAPYLSEMLKGRKGISARVLDKIGLRQTVVRKAS